MFAVDCNYLSTYAQELVCGRGFSETYGDESNKVVLNERGRPSFRLPLGARSRRQTIEDGDIGRTARDNRHCQKLPPTVDGCGLQTDLVLPEREDTRSLPLPISRYCSKTIPSNNR